MDEVAGTLLAKDGQRSRNPKQDALDVDCRLDTDVAVAHNLLAGRQLLPSMARTCDGRNFGKNTCAAASPKVRNHSSSAIDPDRYQRNSIFPRSVPKSPFAGASDILFRYAVTREA